jgi:hypothetical protein
VNPHPKSMQPRMRTLVVLGCRVRLDGEGRLHEGTLRRRVVAAAEDYRKKAGGPTLVVTSGGRRWEGQVEADVMARELERHGVPEGLSCGSGSR